MNADRCRVSCFRCPGEGDGRQWDLDRLAISVWCCQTPGQVQVNISPAVYQEQEYFSFCRYTLQYTYPYAYYMESCPRKHLVGMARSKNYFLTIFILLVWVPTSSTRSGDRKFKLEDRTRWNYRPRRPGKPDGHRREKKVSCQYIDDAWMTFLRIFRTSLLRDFLLKWIFKLNNNCDSFN